MQNYRMSYARNIRIRQETKINKLPPHLCLLLFLQFLHHLLQLLLRVRHTGIRSVNFFLSNFIVKRNTTLTHYQQSIEVPLHLCKNTTQSTDKKPTKDHNIHVKTETLKEKKVYYLLVHFKILSSPVPRSRRSISSSSDMWWRNCGGHDLLLLLLSLLLPLLLFLLLSLFLRLRRVVGVREQGHS